MTWPTFYYDLFTPGAALFPVFLGLVVLLWRRRDDQYPGRIRIPTLRPLWTRFVSWLFLGDVPDRPFPFAVRRKTLADFVEATETTTEQEQTPAEWLNSVTAGTERDPVMIAGSQLRSSDGEPVYWDNPHMAPAQTRVLKLRIGSSGKTAFVLTVPGTTREQREAIIKHFFDLGYERVWTEDDRAEPSTLTESETRRQLEELCVQLTEPGPDATVEMNPATPEPEMREAAEDLFQQGHGKVQICWNGVVHREYQVNLEAVRPGWGAPPNPPIRDASYLANPMPGPVDIAQEVRQTLAQIRTTLDDLARQIVIPPGLLTHRCACGKTYDLNLNRCPSCGRHAPPR